VYSYDPMGRLAGFTSGSTELVKGISYSAADRLTSIKHLIPATGQYLLETRSYDSRNNLSRIVAGPEQAKPVVDLEYEYMQDARVSKEKDHAIGDDTAFEYDAVGHLSAAETGSWRVECDYDGFGNLQSQQPKKGRTPALSAMHDPATNWLLSDDTSYDANGNIVRLPFLSMNYDTENRIIQATDSLNGTERYAYDPMNRRVWRQLPGGEEQVCLYDLGSQLLATYKLSTDPSNKPVLTLVDTNLYFGRKKLLRSHNEPVITDRRGNVRAWIGAKQDGAKYFPFGTEADQTKPSDREKFGAYVRSSTTNLDYAEQRYYSSKLGRFVTPDPHDGSVDLTEPDTWNRYAFVRNDPANRIDPHGLEDDWGDSGYDDYGYDYGYGGGVYVTGTADPVPYDPFPLPSLGVEYVYSTITYWDTSVTVTYPGAADPPQTAYNLSVGYGAYGVVGGLQGAYIPGSNTWCVGAYLGIGTPGISVSGGTITADPGVDVTSIVQGASWGLSGNNPYAGGQVVVSGGNGAVGAQVGTTGVSLTYGGSICFP
jgi:RHS repeat-associated protein